MSTVIENVDTSNSYGKRLHVKGASEIVLSCCVLLVVEAIVCCLLLLFVVL